MCGHWYSARVVYHHSVSCIITGGSQDCADPSLALLHGCWPLIKPHDIRTDEREERTQFVIERGLLDLKKIQSMERKRTREEREVVPDDSVTVPLLSFG